LDEIRSKVELVLGRDITNIVALLFECTYSCTVKNMEDGLADGMDTTVLIEAINMAIKNRKYPNRKR
jgi:hypothetical protein